MTDLLTTHYIKRGNRLPELKGQLLDEVTGLPISLVGATLKFHMQDPQNPTTPLINQPAVVDGDPTLGRFKYAWAVGDTDHPAGRYPFEIEATFSGNRTMDVPNKRHGTVVIAEVIA